MSTKKKKRAFPVYFREWRRYRGLTQEQAAERVGVGQSQLSRFENGRDDFTRANLEALAFAYGCEPADLFRPPVMPKNDLEAYVMGLKDDDKTKALRILKAALEGDKDERAA